MTPADSFSDDPLEFLGRTVQQFAETYRGLLTQSAPVEYCREAGRTFRDVFGHYCRTLNTAMEGEEDSDEDYGDDPDDRYEGFDDEDE